MIDITEDDVYFDALSDASDEINGEDLKESDDQSEHQKSENLGFELGLWASSFGVSSLAVSALLALLCAYHPSLS